MAEGLHLAGTYPKVLKVFCYVYYNEYLILPPIRASERVIARVDSKGRQSQPTVMAIGRRQGLGEARQLPTRVHTRILRKPQQL